ncbi:hypothetical protein CLOSTHATH_04116 [Hungatella hathewayi DSM 13479]|uniref:Uncharacterized protein n=1 Tax=Hungatella hathewayi DSM 13479 TaxID=566550 RepID=D3AKH2_9FIRM|nr:hypothetical protein CLOSTHATH_04116 [Hungatella hathewayi DSM 13479]
MVRKGRSERNWKQGVCAARRCRAAFHIMETCLCDILFNCFTY